MEYKKKGVTQGSTVEHPFTYIFLCECFHILLNAYSTGWNNKTGLKRIKGKQLLTKGEFLEAPQG